MGEALFRTADFVELADRVGIVGAVGWSPNQIFYAHSGNGASGNSGLRRDQPLATLSQAVAKCTSGAGDVIFLLPGHNESLDAATDAVIDKEGVTIFGCGVGMNRPVFDYDGTAGTIEMDAANCRITNCVFRASIASVAVAINVDANNCTIDNCLWTFESTGDEFVLSIDIDTVNFTVVRDNFITTETGAGASTHGIRMDTADYTIVENNIIEGAFSTGGLVIEGAACTECTIRNNIIHNTAEYGAIILAASTGTLHNNVVSGVGTLASVFTFGNMQAGRNWTNDAVANRGTQLIPGTSAA